MMSKIIIRPARPEDKDAVLAFCQRIWDGDDYIPDVWDEWLSDPDAQTFVAVIDDKPVAIDRAAILSDHEAWWQGLRVDPDYRGRGIVGEMDPHLVDYCRAAGAGVIRLATSSENTIVHGMMDRRGFERIARYAWHQAQPLAEPLRCLEQLQPHDVDAIQDFLGKSDVFQSVHGLYDSRGWVWQELTEQELADRLQRGSVWGHKSNGDLRGFAIFSPPEEDEEDELWIGYADGAAGSLAAVLRDLRRLAQQRDLPRVAGHFPALPRVFEALTEAGYVRSWAGEMWIYEVPVSLIEL